MNVARLNMCHGSHEWHTSVIDSIRRLNKEKGYCVAIMVDTEGSEVHTGELQKPLKAETGAEFTFTVRDVSKGNESGENEKNRVIGVSYDGFVDDVEPGDAIVVDGGMVSLEVVSKAGPDVLAVVVEPGLVLSRANLTFRRGGSVLRARNSMLPVLSSKDWLDIDFALAQEVDFIAVSFVKSADVINNLKSYLAARGGKSGRAIEVIAKVESFDSVPNLAEIVEASDAVMVARGDLGAQIPMEDVPSVQKEVSHRVASSVPWRPFFLFTFERKGKKQNKKQKNSPLFLSSFLSFFPSIPTNKQKTQKVVTRCRQAGKPVIVASHLLQSMIEYPTPTRAEVADVSDVVRQRADALMLSGESAVGAYAVKAVEVLRGVATHSEDWVRRERHGALVLPRLTDAPDGRASEELCAAAAQLAGNLGARAIFVYTRRGYMANFLSRCRPDCPVFAFTDSQDVRRRLNLRWGVMPFRLDFSADPEENVTRTFALLKRRDMVARGDLVVVVSDIRTLDQASEAARASGRPDDGTGVVRSVQVRRVP